MVEHLKTVVNSVGGILNFVKEYAQKREEKKNLLPRLKVECKANLCSISPMEETPIPLKNVALTDCLEKPQSIDKFFRSYENELIELNDKIGRLNDKIKTGEWVGLFMAGMHSDTPKKHSSGIHKDSEKLKPMLEYLIEKLDEHLKDC